jgi:hypothetical protein
MGRWVTALVACSALAAAGQAQASVKWLCKPGMAPNPCTGSLRTTAYTPEGARSVQTPAAVKRPRIDCFYVYPTVSDQPTANASKSVDPAITSIAQYQAARYSQRCRVYAPVYRQTTLLGILVPATRPAGAANIAYGDVREAWREYLRRYNDGRGVVVIGHSQGTRMLRRLVREEIDPKPSVRRRLVSAILLGGNVKVLKGRDVGGDFKHIPACRSPRQIRCVIAFSTFNEAPPANSRFGRSAEAAADPWGLPTGPKYEVLCTNPASLAANAESPFTTYLRSEPYIGLIGLVLIQMYSGLPPMESTPWIQPRDHYTGRCETVAGANVLMTHPVGSARHLRPAPDATWGLHIADMNLPLGELVTVVASQERTYVRATAR